MATNVCTVAAKTLRDGIGMAGITSADGALDFLLCNVLLIDPVRGIVKGDLGIRNGRIVGFGKAGNPAISGQRRSEADRLDGNDCTRLRRPDCHARRDRRSCPFR